MLTEGRLWRPDAIEHRKLHNLWRLTILRIVQGHLLDEYAILTDLIVVVLATQLVMQGTVSG